MTRPRGEIREACAQSAASLYQEYAQAVTYRDISVHANVGWAVAQRTVENMARAGELVKIGQVHMEGVCRPLNAYVPADLADPASDEITKRTAELTNAVNSWANFV